MKVLVLFMTFLIFASLFDLCGSTDNCLENEKIGAVDWSQGPFESNVCSPFCSCATCSFSVLMPVPSDISKKTEFLLSGQDKINIEYGIQFCNAIWQPPRTV